MDEKYLTDGDRRSRLGLDEQHAGEDLYTLEEIETHQGLQSVVIVFLEFRVLGDVHSAMWAFSRGLSSVANC